MKRLFAIIMLIGAASSCGGGSDAPQLSELTLSQTEIRYGDEFFASFEATDRDGDLDRATVTVRINGPEELLDGDEEVELEAIVDATEIEAGAVEANMAVALKLAGQMPLGIYKLYIRVTDGGGNESEPAKARINLIPGGGVIRAF